MTRKNALGKGLGALFSDLVDNAGAGIVSAVCGIEELSPNPYQPRKVFDRDELNRLASSISEKGIIQPIVVRRTGGGYEIIAGERRWRAAQTAGLKEVPIVIRDADDAEVAQLSLIENLQREELNPIEEAHAYRTLVDRFDLSQEAVALIVGKDRSTVTNTLRLLKLPQDIQDALSSKKITVGHARPLLSVESVQNQLYAFNRVMAKRLSVRETELLVKKLTADAPKQSVRHEKEQAIVDLENRLSRHYLAKITINPAVRGGSIEIRYTSADDLNRLLTLLAKNDHT
ncbi:MAG: ParB/RepB/Spo0J family partition protein [Deltaproteobacteria bacterium]|nr:ParB/RepB/Spo0J family partition protein [Deltaproteobacteria bacterium]